MAFGCRARWAVSPGGGSRARGARTERGNHCLESTLAQAKEAQSPSLTRDPLAADPAAADGAVLARGEPAGSAAGGHRAVVGRAGDDRSPQWKAAPHAAGAWSRVG